MLFRNVVNLVRRFRYWLQAGPLFNKNTMQDFEEYLRQGEPNKAEKARVWKTAIGLQQVDGLKPSDYLIATAKQNIEGSITIDEVKLRIDTYYQQQAVKNDKDRTEEADKVSARIAEILSEDSFAFHRQNIFPFIAAYFKVFTATQEKFEITILPKKNGC
jgi:hypothetical protein